MNLQNNPGSNFQQLLREQIDKDYPRRKEFTKEEQQKLDKLNSILKKLMRGENVQNRQLQTGLTQDENSTATQGISSCKLYNSRNAELIGINNIEIKF